MDESGSAAGLTGAREKLFEADSSTLGGRKTFSPYRFSMNRDWAGVGVGVGVDSKADDDASPIAERP